jgi:hypothetical protein
MERFKRSWTLARASWAVIRDNRELLRYPLISGVLVSVLGAILLVILYSMGMLQSGDDGSLSIPGIIGLFLLYMVTYTVVIFCNVALVSDVMAVFDQRSPASGSGWSVARSEIRNILGYAAIASTVGVLLSLLSNKEGAGTQILAAIGGAAWSLATFLVVPVLVVEQVGPLDALKRSASLLKKTWGEQIIGNAGIGLVTGLATVLVVVIGAGLIWLASLASSTALLVVAIALVVLLVAVVAIVTTAMGTVYSAATYRYANNQQVAGFEAANLLPTAFTAK